MDWRVFPVGAESDVSLYFSMVLDYLAKKRYGLFMVCLYIVPVLFLKEGN